jgi:chemotaxis protein MotC
MFARRHWFVRSAFLAVALAAGSVETRAQDQSLDAYKILRSLQFVQDSLVLGDHSASDLQRYLLDSLDKRLRSADNGTLADTRNADAVFVYVMSGGNPATLNFLASRDTQGYLDARVVNVLQKYLDGRGAQVASSIASLSQEYQGSVIGPYLNLVAGNINYPTDPTAALIFYDRTRIDAPGTILEEAALRRSIVAATNLKDVDRAVGYSVRYARRFLHSPYASQFADLFVDLAVTNDAALGHERISEVADLMDPDRAQELYLRISRLASLKGKFELASFTAEEARKLNDVLSGKGRGVLSGLYERIAKVPSAKVSEVVDQLSSISREGLSDRDRALLDAAQRVGEEIVRPVEMSGVGRDADDGSDQPAAAHPDPTTAGSVVPNAPAATNTAVDDFVTQGRNKLGDIDSMLAEGEW